MNKIISIKTNENQILPLGPFIVDAKQAYNCYLFLANEQFFLIDLTPLEKWDLLKGAIEKYTTVDQLAGIVLQHMTMSTMNVIIDLIDEGFKGHLITNRYFAQHIKNANLPIHLIEIESIDFKYGLGHQEFLYFVPMTFLPYPSMFMTYSTKESVLFSSMLMSSYYLQKTELNPEILHKSIFNFHSDMMPSSDYIKIPLKTIKDFEFKKIYPCMGYMLENQVAKEMVDFVLGIDFYNSNQVFLSSVSREKVNYESIVNHMLSHLQTHFPRIEILNTFIGSPIHLQPDPLEVKKSYLEGYKLYHGFFDRIYAKKGLLWLSVLEPVVNRYVAVNGIDKPSIYRSKFVEMTLQNETLDENKKKLEQELYQLNEQIEKAKDQILRCPITKLYIQSFLEQIIKEDLSISLDKNETNGLILVQLDQLLDFNRKYGKETGNEAIRSMAYLIEQELGDQTYLYKQNGPGIFIYQKKTTFDQLEKIAIKVRNAINDSNLFIEKVTASVSMSTLSELKENKIAEQKVKDVIDLAEKRLLTARHKGISEIFNPKKENKPINEGVILLVDEDEVNLNMLFRIFKRVNYDVILAYGVEDAMNLISQNPIDIIISEINLSKIDGFQLKQRLNDTSEYQKIPFIMVSHNKTLDNIKRGNTLDVDLILNKPIIPEELIGHVKRFRERWKKS